MYRNRAGEFSCMVLVLLFWILIEALTIQYAMPFHVHRNTNFALVNSQSTHATRRMWLKSDIRLDWRVPFQTDPHTIAYSNHWPNHQRSELRSVAHLQQANHLVILIWTLILFNAFVAKAWRIQNMDESRRTWNGIRTIDLISNRLSNRQNIRIYCIIYQWKF